MAYLSWLSVPPRMTGNDKKKKKNYIKNYIIFFSSVFLSDDCEERN